MDRTGWCNAGYTIFILKEINRTLVGKITETIATKDDVVNQRDGIKYELEGIRQDIRNWKRDIIWWLFFSSITQVVGTFAIFYFDQRK